jgi:ribosomal protein S6--L-glutamate ligase
MKICFITDNPGITGHPVMGAVLRRLSADHAVRLLDAGTLTADEAIVREEAHPPADLYLLKSHAAQALAVANRMESRGALVVNSWSSSLACQDRVLMARRMQQAQLPVPPTQGFPAWEDIPDRDRVCPRWRFPLMIKSRYSSRGDLVAKVDTLEQLQSLLRQRQPGPFVLQEFVQADGVDIKLWVLDGQVFGARRRSPLETNHDPRNVPIARESLPDDWVSLALKAGRAFGLCLYGVALLVTNQGPFLVDVNSFPGFRGVEGADRVLISLIERLAPCARDGRARLSREAAPST